VKPQPKAAAKAKKPAAKATPVKAAAKKAAPPKAASKKASPEKAVPKKAVPKKAASPKAGAKPASKAVVKKATPAKVVAKVSPSPAKKAAAKPAVKKPSASATAKPAAKSVPKSSQSAAKPAAKPADKPAVKAPAKAAPVPTAAKSAASSKATAAPASRAAPVAAAPKAPAHPVPAPKAPASVPTPPAAPQPGMPPRATKPSARLAQITVPSMAQAVASTAAKASYYQTPSRPVTTPVFVPVKKDPKLANNWKTKSVDQLSDAEVLAMPDAEYMNDKQMAYFRLKLQQIKQDILNNAGETTEHLREETVIVPDPADRATIEEEHALELRTRDRERKLLKKIEQSIGRIDSDDYGYCDETGEPIGVGRLLARPTATLSLEAQQRRELKQKMFGD
jgi:DnaK suppressor protein